MTSLSLAIANYATAYADLEKFQQQEPNQDPHLRPLPKGDQKTSCIGEYYALQFAQTREGWEEAHCSFAPNSQKGWDIKVQQSEEVIRIQVKTVSEFGQGKLSPIHRNGDDPDLNWDRLWLLFLDTTLRPVLFWELDYQHVRFDEHAILKGKTMRIPTEPQSGSHCFDWEQARNLTEPLQSAIIVNQPS